MAELRELRVRQIEEALQPFDSLRLRPPPPSGWAKAIRQALGLSLRQMARRTGLAKTSIERAELGEANGTVQLATLRRIADGLDCDLVYALVPRRSLSDTLELQARRKAEALVLRIADSMKLEQQGVGDEETARQVEEVAAQLLRDRDRSFWDG